MVSPTQILVTPVIPGGTRFTVTGKTAGQPPCVYVMVVEPGRNPVTRPVEAPTVATAVLLLLQTPPVVASVNVTGVPMQILEDPEIAAGDGSIVTVLVTVQLAPGAKVIIATPADTPDTRPVVEPTLAIDGSLLLHVPVPTRLKNKEDSPSQMVDAPVMADGGGVTVTTIFVVSDPPLQSYTRTTKESIPV